jgi:hypothetical protein
MDEETPPAKPRLEFRRGRTSAAPAARKHVPVEDALAKMAGKVEQRRRSQDEARGRASDETF